VVDLPKAGSVAAPTEFGAGPNKKRPAAPQPDSPIVESQRLARESASLRCSNPVAFGRRCCSLRTRPPRRDETTRFVRALVDDESTGRRFVPCARDARGGLTAR
jgi:hypothetical protein